MLCRRLFYQTVTGRNRCRRDPKKGRFTKRDAARILQRAWKNYGSLFADMSSEKTVGSRAMVRSGIWSLAVYRTIRETGVEENYATELCTDYLWKAYKRQVGIQRLIARVFVRDGQRQMNMMQRMFLRFPPPDTIASLQKPPAATAHDLGNRIHRPSASWLDGRLADPYR